MLDIIKDQRQTTVRPVGIMPSFGLRNAAASLRDVGRLGEQLGAMASERIQRAEQKYLSDSAFNAVSQISELERTYNENATAFLENAKAVRDGTIEAAPSAIRDDLREFYDRKILSSQQQIENRIFTKERKNAIQAAVNLTTALETDTLNRAFAKGMDFIGEYESSREDYRKSLLNQGLSSAEISAGLIDFEKKLLSTMSDAHAVSLSQDGSEEDFEKFKKDFIRLSGETAELGSRLSPEERIGIISRSESIFNNFKTQKDQRLSIEATSEISAISKMMESGLLPNTQQVTSAYQKASQAGDQRLMQRVTEIAQAAEVLHELKAAPLPVAVQQLKQIKDEILSSPQASAEKVNKLQLVENYLSGAQRLIEQDPRQYFEEVGDILPDEREIGVNEINADFIKQKLSERKAVLNRHGVDIGILKNEQIKQFQAIMDDPNIKVSDKTALVSNLSGSVRDAFDPSDPEGSNEAAYVLQSITKNLTDNGDYTTAFSVANAGLPAAQRVVNEALVGKQLEERPKVEGEVKIEVIKKLQNVIGNQPNALNTAVDVVKNVYAAKALNNKDGWEILDQKILNESINEVIGEITTRKGQPLLPFRNQRTGQWVESYVIDNAFDALNDDFLKQVNPSVPVDPNTGAELGAKYLKDNTEYVWSGNGRVQFRSSSGADVLYKDENGAWRPYELDVNKLLTVLPAEDLEQDFIQKMSVFDYADQEDLSRYGILGSKIKEMFK